MQVPAADITVDQSLVGRLIQSQHPDLDGPLALVANGWDNAIYRLGDDLCVRLPRRRVAADLIRNEQRWLPVLAGRVDVGTPVPVRVGVPTADFPWYWSICAWFDGRPAIDLPPAERAPSAADLAVFMIQLHLPAPADAPRNPVRGVPLEHRTVAVHERLASGAIPRSDRLRAIWDELVAIPPWAGPPLWLHGDPHPANLLLGSGPFPTDAAARSDVGGRRLHAVLDFGDVTAGDPACDLAAAWLVFDPDARATFRAHLDSAGGVDEDTWARARGWALNIGSAIAVNSDDNPRMAAVGRHALDQILLES